MSKNMLRKNQKTFDKIKNDNTIHDRLSLSEYWKADFFRYTGRYATTVEIIFVALFIANLKQKFVGFGFLFWYRVYKSKTHCCKLLSKFIMMRIRLKYGIDIPTSVQIGYGCFLAHASSGVVMHTDTIIGSNFTIRQFCTIGKNLLEPGQTIIGDKVNIGANSSIIGNIKIGGNVVVGAGAVVVKDVPDDAVVGGVPAKILNYRKTSSVENPADINVIRGKIYAKHF